MEKIPGKHNKWVVFYALMIVSFFLFAFVSIGVLKLKVPHLPFDNSSPDFAVTTVKTLCDFEKYENIALRSVKFEKEEYDSISKDDLSVNPAGSSGYLGAAEGLCNAFTNSRKVVKAKVSDSEWDYTYYFGILFDASRIYKIIYFDGDWRFVLSK